MDACVQPIAACVCEFVLLQHLFAPEGPCAAFQRSGSVTQPKTRNGWIGLGHKAPHFDVPLLFVPLLIYDPTHWLADPYHALLLPTRWCLQTVRDSASPSCSLPMCNPSVACLSPRGDLLL